jgi:hypothetical protein
MKKQAAAEKAAAEAAEAKEYNWESDPIGYREKFPAIAKTQELGEKVGERVRALAANGAIGQQAKLSKQISEEGDWMDRFRPYRLTGNGVADGFADGVGREDPRTQTIKVSGDFTAAEKFDGWRKGYTYTMGEKGRGYYLLKSLDKSDDKYVVKPGLFVPGGVKKDAETAYGEEYWSFAIPFLGKDRRGDTGESEPSAARDSFGGRFAFFDVFKSPPDSKEAEEAAAMRKAYDARVKKEKREAREEIPLETGVLTGPSDPRDALKWLGPIDRAPQVVKAEMEAAAKAEAEAKAKEAAEAKAKAEAEKKAKEEEEKAKAAA